MPLQFMRNCALSILLGAAVWVGYFVLRYERRYSLKAVAQRLITARNRQYFRCAFEPGLEELAS